MGDVLLRAFSLTLIILLGIVLRAAGIVPKEAAMITRNIMFYVSLPAALMINFMRLSEIGTELLWVALFGTLGNGLMLLLSFVVVGKYSRKRKILYLFCLPGYGIGAFTLSFVQSFLSPTGNVAVCFFDMGNCVLCSGLCYAIVAEYLSEERQGIDFKAIGKHLLRSAPLVVCAVMTVLLILRISVPRIVADLIQPIANANPFVSMLMLGLFFHMEMKREYLSEIIRINVIRILYAIPLALFFYFYLPFDLVIRQALVLVSFAPTTVNCPGFVSLCGGDDGLASAASSISILVSMVITVAMLGIMGI